MKHLTLTPLKRILFLFLVTLAATACNKQEVTIKVKPTPTIPTQPDKPTTDLEYYITFKVNGTQISLTEVSGSRNLSKPRVLTIEGSATGGAAPKFKFAHEESFIGFVAGLNVVSSNISYPLDYAQYTNSSNALYETQYDSNGLHLFISAISYTNGGAVAGIFDGTMKTKDGASIQITDGKYKVKFKN